MDGEARSSGTDARWRRRWPWRRWRWAAWPTRPPTRRTRAASRSRPRRARLPTSRPAPGDVRERRPRDERPLAGGQGPPVAQGPERPWNGAAVAEETFDTTGRSNASMGWSSRSVEAVASGPTSTLGFAGDVT